LPDSVHDGHRARLRERFINAGADALAPHELLELLLSYSIPRADTNPTAHALLDRFGSLSDTLSASADELCSVNGVGERSAVLIALVAALARRCAAEETSAVRLDTVDAIGRFFAARYVGVSEETVMLALLDNAMRPIRVLTLFRGSVNSAALTPRKAIEAALLGKAAFAVIAHNHPKGLAVPSVDDIHTTQQLREAFSLVGIPLVEHVIVAGDRYVALAAEGFLDATREKTRVSSSYSFRSADGAGDAAADGDRAE
jgi:DNA repair protein RadC